MGSIIKEIEIQGDKNKTSVKAVFDTGASNCLIRKEVANKIATITKTTTPIEFRLADGEGKMKAEGFIGINFIIDEATMFYHAIVVDKLAKDLIVGVDLMQRYKLKLDLEKEDVIIDKEALIYWLI